MDVESWGILCLMLGAIAGCWVTFRNRPPKDCQHPRISYLFKGTSLEGKFCSVCKKQIMEEDT